jgi:hypothetical protein
MTWLSGARRRPKLSVLSRDHVDWTGSPVRIRRRSAFTLKNQYRLLQMPVAILVGAEDRVIESEQAAHLHREIRTARYDVFLELDTWCIRQRRRKLWRHVPAKFKGFPEEMAVRPSQIRAALCGRGSHTRA